MHTPRLLTEWLRLVRFSISPELVAPACRSPTPRTDARCSSSCSILHLPRAGCPCPPCTPHRCHGVASTTR
eukprot:6454509-Alexandrium_andersonii.AAC.1